MVIVPGVHVIRLEASRATVRDWKPVDIEPLRTWMRPDAKWHDTNGPYFPRPTARELNQNVERRRVESLTDPADRADPRTSLAIVETETDRLIGQVSWYWESEVTDWRRMGIVIYDPARWCGGFGTQAMRLWTTYLFTHTETVRLDVSTYSGNPGMMGVARKLGFREEGRFRKARIVNDTFYDSLVYGVLREEWPC